LLKQKVAQKVTNILGYFIVLKNHNGNPKSPYWPKITQLVKNRPIWSPWSSKGRAAKMQMRQKIVLKKE
jgi:hypothetical protein